MNIDELDSEDMALLEEATEIAYTAYCKAVGGKAFNGDVLPDWVTFYTDPRKQGQAKAWLEAVNAVIDFVFVD